MSTTSTASPSRRAARSALVVRALGYDSPMTAVRDSGSAHVHRGVRRAERLWDQGEHLASRSALFDVNAAAERMEARAFALQLRSRAPMYAAAIEEARASSDGATTGVAVDYALREVAAEFAATGRATPKAAPGLLEEAFRFVTCFDATVCALEQGRISPAHAKRILKVGFPLDDDARRAEFERIVLDAAADKNPAELERYARQIVERFMTVSLDERHAEARKRRYVALEQADDGMAYLIAFMPVFEATAIHATLTSAARSQQQVAAEAVTAAKAAGDHAAAEAADDRRTLDEIRTDVLAAYVLTTDLARGGNPYGTWASVNANIDVTVSATSLVEQVAGTATDTDTDTAAGARIGGDGAVSGDAGADDRSGDTAARIHPVALVNGRIPIPVGTARELLSTCTSFTRVLTDPFTGMAVSVERRFATNRMREFLRVRDAHCRWPGCTIPAARCQVDHTVAVEDGGPTTLANLEHLCLGHHLLKHRSRWLVEQLGGGVMRWTSPTGRVFTTTPQPVDLDPALSPPSDDRPPGEDSVRAAPALVPVFRPSDDDDPPPF